MLKRLAALKSDFLLLPEYFYADKNSASFKQLREKNQYTKDWLTKLNDAYRGVVIAGSLFREEEGFAHISAPVLSGGEIVDWYDKRELSNPEQEVARQGSESSTFILGGQRFAVLLGDEIYNAGYVAQLAENDIKLIFVLALLNGASPSDAEAIKADEERIADLAREHQIHFVRCCSTGTFMGKPVHGRSLVAGPSGITWRISPEEEGTELLKTIMLNIRTL